MNTIHKLSICALVVLMFPNVAFADDNVEIMKKLYSKIATIVGVGSNDPVFGNNFLVLANPGLPLDPNINTNTTQGLYQVVGAIDNILLPKFIYQRSGGKTYSIYRDILDYRELPLITPTVDEVKAYKVARSKIFSDASGTIYTPAYEKYREKQLALATAQDKIKTFQNGNPYADVPNVYYAELDQAQKDFDLIGNADELIGAYEVTQAYGRGDPNVWWGERRDNFRKATRQFSGQNFGIYNFFPAYSVWLDGKRTWTGLTISDQDIQQTTKSSHTEVGGGFSAGWGLWSVGASGSSSEDRTSFQLNGKTYTLTFEVARVDIDRPWLEYAVFESNAWRWSRASPRNKDVSDGGNALSGVTPDGIMPFLPVGLLLARNVTISGDWTDKFEETIKKQSSGGASVGWGPFHFGVSSASSSNEEYKKYKLSNNAITFTSPQILGFFVQVLPKSPNPDLKNYKWPSEGMPLAERIRSKIDAKNTLKARGRMLLKQKIELDKRIESLKKGSIK